MPWEAITVGVGTSVSARGAGWILPINCAIELQGGLHFGSPLAFVSSFVQALTVVASPRTAPVVPATHHILPPHPPLPEHAPAGAQVLVCVVALPVPYAAHVCPLEFLPANAALAFPASWIHFTSQLTSHSVAVVLGDKDVGKSTLALYICNSVAASRSAYLLDLDPGQPDLSPSGLLSLHRIIAPCALHGPAWVRSHRAPLASYYYGATTPKHNPDQYLRIVRALAELAAKERMVRPGPLIVNTPGWVRGFGSHLQLQIIGAVQPTLLVMLHTPETPPPLSADEIAAACPDAYSLHLAPLVRVESARLSAAETRDLSLAAYMSSDTVTTLAFAQVDILLPSAVPPSQLLRVLNGAIVGVTLLEEEIQDSPAARRMPMRVLTGEELLPPRCQFIALAQSVDALALRIELLTASAIPPGKRVRLTLGELYPSAALLARRAGPAAVAAGAPYLALASQLHDRTTATSSMTARPSLQRKKHRKS